MDKYKHQLLKERLALLKEINDATDRPLFYLSFVWLALIIFELTTGINRQLEYLNFAIWIIFIEATYVSIPA
jgi:voltage-gated potassium channel